MKKSSCQQYLNIYVENPEIIRLLIYKDDNDKILGRALIWKLNAYNDLDNKAPYFMDRVYTIDDATKKLFKDFAVTQKWAFRTSSTYHRTKEVTFLGDEKDSISLEKITKKDLPFINEVRNEVCKEYLHDSQIFTLEQTVNNKRHNYHARHDQ